ncbi:hypothetical protein [Leptothrix ochracea]|uniref:hypothetical protein n=1 Tax=Leptothrix ochracea TaxID=735331 RepID=UPI0034E25191
MVQFFFKLIKNTFGLLLAMVVIFEEWGWEPLMRFMGWLAHIPLVGWIERRIAALPPYGALVAFFAPGTLLLPVKLLALWAIGQGHTVLGVGVIVAAKLVGTAVLARIFILTQPALMRIQWFANLYRRWVPWKDALLLKVRSSHPWRLGRLMKRRFQRQIRRQTKRIGRWLRASARSPR